MPEVEDRRCQLSMLLLLLGGGGVVLTYPMAVPVGSGFLRPTGE